MSLLIWKHLFTLFTIIGIASKAARYLKMSFSYSSPFNNFPHNFKPEKLKDIGSATI